MLLPVLLALIWIWLICFWVSFKYLKSLFRDLRFSWNAANRFCCLMLCVAGPAALICGLAVDLARPLI